MQRIHQELRFCPSCNKNVIFQGNKNSINWVMHIALIFLGGIGLITLPCALINRALNARVGGKHGLFCSQCGISI